MQQFDSVIHYNAITLSVLLKGYYYYYYKLQFMCIQQFSSVILTARVTYSSSIVQVDKIH